MRVGIEKLNFYAGSASIAVKDILLAENWILAGLKT